MTQTSNTAETDGLNSPNSPLPARFILLGGFPGAGKTTAFNKLASYLANRGHRVGLITNGHEKEILNGSLWQSKTLPSAEPARAKALNHFSSISQAVEAYKTLPPPDLLLFEPQGDHAGASISITDSIHAIFHSDIFLAPLSVLVDAVRALRIFDLEPGARFSDKVVALYKKQLDAAQIIVINKMDLMDPTQLELLHKTLQTGFPSAKIFEISARNGAGLMPWFEYLLNAEGATTHRIQTGLELYLEGESRMGWLNSTIRLSSMKGFDSGAVLTGLAAAIQKALADQGAEIAHLKMTFSPDEDLQDIAVVHLVGNDHRPELVFELPEPTESGRMRINLRAEGLPDQLHGAVTDGLFDSMLRYPNLFARMEHLEHFRPPMPPASQPSSERSGYPSPSP